jgi:hypothetical protein
MVVTECIVAFNHLGYSQLFSLFAVVSIRTITPLRMPSSGMLRRVGLVRINASEGGIVSIIRVTRFGDDD